MGTLIKISGLTKEFRGIKVLDNITIDFDSGKIHGVIGRNGSGKTVLLKCICGLMKATSGTIKINDVAIEDDVPQNISIGAIIETPGFIPSLNGFKNLKFLSELDARLSKRQIYDAMEDVGLEPKSKKKVGQYSLGMKQRLGIAQAIMEQPKLLVLDEPMNGLDNKGIVQMRQLFLNLKKSGTTIILASHSKEDIVFLCDTVMELSIYSHPVCSRVAP